jgi:hypothetical protein
MQAAQQSYPTAVHACRWTALLHCKGTLVVDTKKKFQVFQVSVGSGRLWYFNPDALQDPLDIILLHGATVKPNAAKDKGDADKHLFQATLEKDKALKIHFSFDSANECNEWIALMNQLIEEASPSLFGTSVIDAALKTNSMVPTFVSYMIGLLKPGMATEGIFRLPGSQNLINDLKARYAEGEEPVLDPNDVQTLASLLKVYFRELSTPIVPPSHVGRFFEAANITDLSKFSAALKDLVSKLPEPSRITLTYLIKFFKEVSSHSAQNKMEPSNIAIATAPSLLKAQSGKDELSAATQSLRVVERMITDYTNIFNPEDEAKANSQPMGSPGTSNPIDRPEMTAAERPIVSAVLAQHHENADTCYYLRVLKYLPKSKSLEDSLLVLGTNRLYAFAHGKLESEYPILDLQEISSQSLAHITLTFGNSVSKNTTEIKFRSCSTASFDSTVFIVKLHNNWQDLFVGAPADLLKVSVADCSGEDRLKLLTPYFQTPNLDDGCGGFVKAYQAYSDYFGVPPLEDFIWDLENLFANNYIRDFILSECVRKDKYPNDEVKCFMLCLAHNTWFTSIVADNQKLGNETALQLVNVFKTNRQVRTLKLSNVGATSQVFLTLAENIMMSPYTALNWINISLNSLDDKSVEKLGASFEKLASLVHLDVSGCGISKKGMPTLLESLHKSSAICGTLEFLDISNNSLDSVDASRQLGLVLGKVKALRELNIASTSTNFLNVLAAFEKSGLTSLNISDTKVTPKTQDDITDFLKRSPQLQSLIMINVNVSPIQLNDILTTHSSIKVLDISDTDFGDEGVLALCEFLFSRPAVAPVLAELNMNRVFPKRTKDRAQAINSLANLLESRPITALRMRGGPKSQLKTDLVPLVFGLINNDRLVLLDVAGNQCGDGLPLAFAKILQHNHTLQTLYWDDNGTTMAGLRSFKIGLARNTSIRKMPLPVLDMANILKTETDLQAVVTLSSEIQEIVFDNALKTTVPSESARNSLQQSSSEGSISPSVSAMAAKATPPKKPIEQPRGRLASTAPGAPKDAPVPTLSGAKKGLGASLGSGVKKMAAPMPVASPSNSLSPNSAAAPSAEGEDPSRPRGHSKSISKASVHRASLLFSGTTLPLEDENGAPVTINPDGSVTHLGDSEPGVAKRPFRAPKTAGNK